MIAVELIGGLGNQMFQYAAGAALANIHKTDLFIDSSGFDTYKPHSFELKSTQADLRELNKQNYKIIEPRIGLKGALRAFKSAKPQLVIYREEGFAYNSRFTRLPDKTFLKGYYQSEQYFIKNRAELLKDFMPRRQGQFAKKLGQELSRKTAIALHIRRGDYVTNPVANKFHGSLGLDYYRKAVRKLMNIEPHAVIYVFSDDILWCKKNLKLGYKLAWIEGEHSAIEGINLMAQCSHNIIANSSFSWWGAWLNENPDKIVIAPKQWFISTEKNTKDVIPDSWYKL